MAKKKEEESAQPTQKTDISEVLGKYVDPSNDLAVRVIDSRIIINCTQVSQENIDGLRNDLEGTGFVLEVVEKHPSLV